MTSNTASTMSSNLSLASRRAVIHCPRSDCDYTFSDPELLDLHITRVHKLNVPMEPVNEENIKSLKSIQKQKQTYFQLCPPKLVEQNTILHCLDPDCDHIFDSEGLRDFHYNRMHHARQPSMISQLTGTVEQRLHGYECLKADCDSRFLSKELRDFHVARLHPNIWHSICEAREASLYTKENEPEEQATEEVKRMLNVPSCLAHCQRAELLRLLSRATNLSLGPSTLKGVPRLLRNPLSPGLTLSTELINKITTNPRETTSRTQSKGSIFSQESGYSTDATSVSIISEEEDSAEKPNALVFGDAVAEDNQKETVFAGAITIRANSAPVAIYCVENQLAPLSRLTLVSRSRSFFMMNRNAVANPGASMWRPQ